MSAFAVSYPDSVPFDSVREVARTIKDGAVVSNRAAFAHHLWICQGYVQSQAIGDGETDQNIVGAVAPVSLSEAEAVQYLDTVGNFNPQFAAGLSIPWKQLLSWLLKMAADELTK